MTIVAQVALEAEQPDFDQFLANFTDNEITVKEVTNSPPTDMRMLEIRVNRKELLSEFYEMSVEHSITLDIHQIHRIVQD